MTFNSEIKKLYDKSGYLDKYGGSLVVTIIILTCFFLIFSYHFLLGKLNSVKSNWMAEKCNPKYMPFAGILAKDAGSDTFNYTAKNFNECVSGTLRDVARTAVSPITSTANSIMDVQKTNLNALRGVREQINYIRNNTINTVKNIMHRLVGFLIPTQNIMLKIRDTFQKATSIMVSSFYAFLGFMVTLKSSMRYIITTIITFLVALAASVTLQFAVPFNWEMAQLGLQFFLLLAVPAGIISHWFEQTFNITSQQQIPPNPRCFDKNTLLHTTKGFKKIKDIKNGDKLIGGGVVTSIFKLSRKGEKMFNFKGIKITGTHMVHHHDKGWLLISEHEDSKEIIDYNENIVYCINTNTKIININGNIFLDWDETNLEDFYNLKKKTGIVNFEEIHKFLDGGFIGTTEINMLNGNNKNIKNINVDDILKNGEKVLGLVKICAKKLIHVKKYKDLNIIGGPNLQLINNLGNISTLDIIGTNVKVPKFLYHLITDTKNFHVGKNKFLDYNGSLEVFDDV